MDISLYHHKRLLRHLQACSIPRDQEIHCPISILSETRRILYFIFDFVSYIDFLIEDFYVLVTGLRA